MNLTLTEAVTIACREQTVRAILGDPLSWPAFVEKLQHIETDGTGYRGILVFRGRDITFTGTQTTTANGYAMVMQCEDPTRRFTCVMEIRYALTIMAHGVRVVETVTYRQHLNILAWLLVKWIHRFGRAVGRTNLEHLSDLCRAGRG